MKKFLVSALCAILLLFTLTGCSTQSLSLDGAFWQNSLVGEEIVQEHLEYKVTVDTKTPSDSTEVKNEYYSTFEITNGSYIVDFRSSVAGEPQGYVLQTVLDIEGSYNVKLGEETKVYPIHDRVITKTNFKPLAEKLIPYTSERIVENNSVYLGANRAFPVASYAYSYIVTYGEKDATVDFKVTEEKDNVLYNELVQANEKYKELVPYATSTLLAIEEHTTYSNYAKNAYVDNELMLFVPRAFKLKDNYAQNFSTIDVIGNGIKECTYTVDGELKPYTLNGYTTNKLLIKVNDTFSGPYVECYYATNHEQDKHRLIEMYTTLNDSLGFLKYSLVSVS